MLPNFLIVGAMKGGTTTLAAMLSRHPDVLMCTPKEPQFFSGQNWGRGEAWYRSLFHGAEGRRAIGEASPAYTRAPEFDGVPERIHRLLGDVKYIYILRHPIERMVSHYRHALTYHWIPEGISFEDALRRRPDLRNCSRYFYQIEQYLPYTRREQWHTPLLEELVRQPEATQQGIYRFLGIDERVRIPLPADNVTDQKRMLPAWLYPLKSGRDLIPSRVWQQGKRSAVRLLGRRVERPIVSEDVAAGLVDGLRPDLERLSAFCGRDFSSLWHLDL